MNEAFSKMLAHYGCRKPADDPRAMREVLQGVVLLGLWRGRFFERAALCGGSALRLLHGLDRFAADLDFTLLAPCPGFSFAPYGRALVREVRSLGFEIGLTGKAAHWASPLESAFMKAETQQYTLGIEAIRDASSWRCADPRIRIRVEIDTDPPPGAACETRTCPLPIPFSVRTLALPDLLAVKLAGLLARRYYRRAKGRDWYDLAWCAARGIGPNLGHLEARLRRSAQLPDEEPLTGERVLKMAEKVIRILDVEEVRQEALPFLCDPGSIASWSPEFFRDAFGRILAAVLDTSCC
ncbi:MAG: nucleotidyl transferase AbiEii/AbiGii toxin family protein [Deltaproteobacteria bacterium]|nr:nucleotidyl transferase AbiEii/AbiGii toxin family protein [Deltaproteobacteria bacterium]